MKNLPKKIYLNLGDLSEEEYNELDFHDLSQVTWSEDDVQGRNVEYVRKDVLIDKAAVVSELKNLYEDIDKCIGDLVLARSKHDQRGISDAHWKMETLMVDTQQVLSYILQYLEVKEVDLDREIDKWWCSQFTDYSMKRVPNHKFIPAPAYIDSNFKQSETGKTKIAFELWMDWKVDSNDIEWDSETIREFAKHFFELGIKAQKGE